MQQEGGFFVLEALYANQIVSDKDGTILTYILNILYHVAPHYCTQKGLVSINMGEITEIL